MEAVRPKVAHVDITVAVAITGLLAMIGLLAVNETHARVVGCPTVIVQGHPHLLGMPPKLAAT